MYALALAVLLTLALAPQGDTLRYLPIFPLADVGFEALWLPVSGRKDAQPHPVLMQVAQAHANELCYRETVLHEAQGYDLHIDLQGRMPNKRVRDAGYPLPAGYADEDNQIESVVVTHLGERYALKILLDSPSHVDHVTGANEFFAAQTRYGTGEACGAWYVLVTAP